MTAAPTRPGQILFLPEGGVSSSIAALLRAAGHQVDEISSTGDLESGLRARRADLAVVGLRVPESSGQHAAASMADLNLEAARAGAKMVALVRAKGDAQIRALFEQRMMNFLAVADDGSVEPIELTVTVSKLLGNGLFGLGRYLAPGTRLHEVRVVASCAKDNLVDQVEADALAAGCHVRVAQMIGMAADELITNAVYNAPVDAHGNRRFAHYSRDRAVDLAPDEDVTIRWGSDGHFFGVSASDRFGSLRSEKVLDYLTKCFAKGEQQIDLKEGGAGLGLYYLFRLTHHFLINIVPGIRTEAIGLVAVGPSYRAYCSRARSFNIFVGERVDGD